MCKVACVELVENSASNEASKSYIRMRKNKYILVLTIFAIASTLCSASERGQSSTMSAPRSHTYSQGSASEATQILSEAELIARPSDTLLRHHKAQRLVAIRVPVHGCSYMWYYYLHTDSSDTDPTTLIGLGMHGVKCGGITKIRVTTSVAVEVLP